MPSHKKMAPLGGHSHPRISVMTVRMRMGFVVMLVMEDARAGDGRCDNGEREQRRENISK
jgi:hypothetical protein